MIEKKREIIKVGELFCGPGGLGLGASWASSQDNNSNYLISHVWATDYDPDSCETYRRNICPQNPEHVICHDIQKLNMKKLLDISDIDALLFGFPCNDFSIVGQRKGIKGDFGPLYSYGIKALKLFRPKWFLAENVGGLKNSNQGSTLNLILTEMADAGYNVFPHLYKFEDYGIPQTRHRIIIVGIRKDIGIDFEVPSPQLYSSMDISCKTAIEKPKISKNAHNNEKTRQSQIVIERLKHIKPGQNAFDAKLPPHLQLNVKGAKISQIYKRLEPAKPSYTITGSGGGGTHVYHWEENRALTNRERARLQTFPDDFIFYGSKESVRKQIGMAVPPKFSKIIISTIMNLFSGSSCKSVNSNMMILDKIKKPEGYLYK